MTRPIVIGDSIALGIMAKLYGVRLGNRRMLKNENGHAVVGASPRDVKGMLADLSNTQADINELKRRGVLLSTGLSNNADDLITALVQIRRLEDNDIPFHVLGVGTSHKIEDNAGLNRKLQERAGSRFIPLEGLARDKIHLSASGIRKVIEAIEKGLSMSDKMKYNRKVFFDTLRSSRTFGGSFTQGQVEGIEYKLAVWEEHYSSEPDEYLAYCLGTSYHETAARMLPLAEFGKGSGRPYGKAVGPYGHRYYGRGDVQLTWERNYIHAGDKIGVDLHQFPEKALEPPISARVLFQGCLEGWFTGKKLSDYSNHTGRRAVVNGTDKAGKIARHANDFERAIKAAASAPVVVTPDPIPPTPDPEPTKPKGFDIMTLLSRFGTLLGGGGLISQITGCANNGTLGVDPTTADPSQLIIGFLLMSILGASNTGPMSSVFDILSKFFKGKDPEEDGEPSGTDR